MIEYCKNKTTRTAAVAAAAVLALVMIVVTGAAADGAAAPSQTNAPLIELSEGDSFTYTATTNLPTVMTAAGDGLIAEGGWLAWDAASCTLSGTATAAGTYSVCITAVWTGETGATQTAMQWIEYRVTAADGSADQATLTYDSSQNAWDLEFTSSAVQPVASNSSLHVDPLLIVVAAVILILVGFAAVRFL